MTKLTENWAVINENGGVEYTAYTKTMCHDHINDAGSTGLRVEGWVVREIGIVGEQPTTQPEQPSAGGVPEAVIKQCEEAIEYAAEIRGGCITGVREGQKRVRAILTAAPTAPAALQDWLPPSKQWLRYPSHPHNGEQGGSPWAWCFTDVNGKPTEFCESPDQAHEQDLRVRTPLYKSEQGGEWLALPDKFYEGLGWMHAECCAALDRGEDPRAFEVGDMVKRCIHDLTRPQPPKSKEGE